VVRLDPFLRSVSHPEVFGAGDAAVPDACRITIRMGCATAMPMAAVAAQNLVRTIANHSLAPFRYAYMAQFASLGRTDALAQYVRADDSPRPWISTGRLAAWMKELTFKMNLSALYNGFYPVEAMMRSFGVPELALPVPRPVLELG
jgi:NADH dehydrogenase FAD-containing subunit